jgi:hypothetical protein
LGTAHIGRSFYPGKIENWLLLQGTDLLLFFFFHLEGAKNPEKLFENWKLGFPIGAVPPTDHSKSKP